MLKMSIGENLKKIREELGFTQETLAKLAETTPWVIAKAEQNARELKMSTAIKIADALGLTIDEVVGHYVEDPKY